MPTTLPERRAAETVPPIGLVAWAVIPLALAVLTLSLSVLSPVPGQVASDALALDGTMIQPEI